MVGGIKDHAKDPLDALRKSLTRGNGRQSIYYGRLYLEDFGLTGELFSTLARFLAAKEPAQPHYVIFPQAFFDLAQIVDQPHAELALARVIRMISGLDPPRGRSVPKKGNNCLVLQLLSIRLPQLSAFFLTLLLSVLLDQANCMVVSLTQERWFSQRKSFIALQQGLRSLKTEERSRSRYKGQEKSLDLRSSSTDD